MYAMEYGIYEYDPNNPVNDSVTNEIFNFFFYSNTITIYNLLAPPPPPTSAFSLSFQTMFTVL